MSHNHNGTPNCPPKEKLLQMLNEYSFAISDILLYLDTHPNCEKGMEYYRENIKKRRELLALYAQNYGPLTIDTADDCASKSWEWVLQPFPWENKGGCR